MKMQEESIIGIEELEIECIVGILPEERIHPQKITIDLRVAPSLSFSVIQDINQTVDYRVLAEIAKDVASVGKFQLIETMAAEILNAVFARYTIRWAFIRIVKHRVVPGAARAVVELKREI
jgi:7,8-dihydroneopterin aldolase/epimerase/oxygenase